MYQCTGNPEPADIEEIMKTMMNDSFEVAYQRGYPLMTFGGRSNEVVARARALNSSVFPAQVFRL